MLAVSQRRLCGTELKSLKLFSIMDQTTDLPLIIKLLILLPFGKIAKLILTEHVRPMMVASSGMVLS